MMVDRGYKQSGDAGKLDLTLVPEHALVMIAQVFSYGREKYSEDNWRKGLSLSELLQARKRHELKARAGETHDPESGLLHYAHMCCLDIMLLELFLEGKLEIDRALSAELIPHLMKQHNRPENVLKNNIPPRPPTTRERLKSSSSTKDYFSTYKKGYQWPPKPQD